MSLASSRVVRVGADLLPLGLDGVLPLLQPPAHLLLQPLAALLVVGHGRLHPAQLVQQLGDGRGEEASFF